MKKKIEKLKKLKIVLFAFDIFIYSWFVLYCFSRVSITTFCGAGVVLFLALFYLTEFVEAKFLQAVYKQRNELDANLIAKVNKLAIVVKNNTKEVMKYAILWELLKESVATLDNGNEWSETLKKMERDVERDIDLGKYDDVLSKF